eukprot:TRINITY_DN38362_c0_g1_i1.p1 TRINITY_DN38362_c0_g1~~TRINITY_DN38362_c0_g1_i1.p1  ORF type:complete len:817 (+),score=244.66 TRINITY_DN38362_c0_g1_i1:85-2535(+)
MSWFSGALEKAKDRSSSFKAKVGETVRGIAGANTRTQQFHSEVEVRLEGEAQKLRYCHMVSATDIINRWLSLWSAIPQHRYLFDLSQLEDCAPRTSSELTFRQVFLRSQALAHAIDAATHSTELRSCLREHALMRPEAWPQQMQPPMAFARAFVELLSKTIGPSEAWQDILAALLTADAGPVDDQCHDWLVQLLARKRRGWEDAALCERQLEVESIEEEAARAAGKAVAKACSSTVVRTGYPSQDVQAGGSSASSAPPPPPPPPRRPSSKTSTTSNGATAAAAVPTTNAARTAMLAEAMARGRAAALKHEAWRRRTAFAADLHRAASRRQDRARETRQTAVDIAAAAKEREAELEVRLGDLEGASERRRRQMGEQAEELRGQLGGLDPGLLQLQKDIDDAEMTKKELLAQVKALEERIQGLRRRKSEVEEKRRSLGKDLSKVEADFATQASSEDEEQRRTQCARALAATVAALAARLSADTDGFTDEASVSSANNNAGNEVASSASTASTPRSQSKSVNAASADDLAVRAASIAAARRLDLARDEVARLQFVAKTASCVADEVEERARSRKTMQEMGVSSETLQSDVVGEAELRGAVQGALGETMRCQPEVEALLRDLAGAAGQEADKRGVGGAEGEGEGARENGEEVCATAKCDERQLIEDLRTALQGCVEARKRLHPLAEQFRSIETASEGGYSCEDAAMAQAQSELFAGGDLADATAALRRGLLGLAGVKDVLAESARNATAAVAGKERAAALSAESCDAFLLGDYSSTLSLEAAPGETSQEPVQEQIDFQAPPPTRPSQPTGAFIVARAEPE